MPTPAKIHSYKYFPNTRPLVQVPLAHRSRHRETNPHPRRGTGLGRSTETGCPDRTHGQGRQKIAAWPELARRKPCRTTHLRFAELGTFRPARTDLETDHGIAQSRPGFAQRFFSVASKLLHLCKYNTVALNAKTRRLRVASATLFFDAV